MSAKYWDGMAAFVLGDDSPPEDDELQPRQSATVALLGRVAPLLLILLAFLGLGIGYLLLTPLGFPGWIHAILFTLYLSIVRAVATRI